MDVTLRKKKFQARCPSCGHQELELTTVDSKIYGDDTTDCRLVCPECGISGIGYEFEEAYRDMRNRAPLHSLEEVLSAYLGTISITLDDLNKTIGEFARTIKAIQLGKLSE